MSPFGGHFPRSRRLPMVIWHVCISGFLQSEARMNGILRLWLDTVRPLQDPRTFTTYRRWNSHWPSLAEFIQNTRGSDELRVGVYAYSYGAGWGAMRLATALRRRGIAVDEMVLSDPVYRHGCRSLAWLSLVRGPRIRVPANVKRLTWFYQRTNRPAGHALVDAAGHPVPGLFVPGVIHQAMDDLPAFHEACRAAALSLHALRESLEAQPAATSSLVLPGRP